ncbi:MAG TPA: XdhC family protein [Kiloniellales bacterium]|nr:XdhC family protein [Kiloniellales bacterium]
MKQAILDTLLAARRAKRPVALVTNLESGRQALLDEGVVSGELVLGGVVLSQVERALAEDKSGLLSGTSLFVQVFNPPLRLIVVGAVHIAQALVPLAALVGYETIVVDPRRAWATDARFPDIALMTDWPDEALAALAPDRRTAVVTLTHDPKLDDPALTTALNSDAFYIGALGSTRTHAKRLARLRETGLGEAELTRIHGPAGLAIGARSPAEIAVSILAQMTQALHGAPALVKAEAAQ